MSTVKWIVRKVTSSPKGDMASTEEVFATKREAYERVKQLHTTGSIALYERTYIVR